MSKKVEMKSHTFWYKTDTDDLGNSHKNLSEDMLKAHPQFFGSVHVSSV